ncbi:glycine zipper 2TM domain-containing protein [Ramlibacter sp. WS9]|uniref:glycine zipper 2TM domain-containing protein n=1 Tax=Ramlibacter sp. WS9 TaxID=1882741 RepID=UPI00130512BA|nr:glycine zipper 2TM domain-containing protein [Ramlibacter sp. WS9]
MRTTRLASIASLTALAALLSACVSRPIVVNTVPPTVAAAPATTIVTTPAPASLEMGRITNIEFFQAGAPTSGINVPGAIVGGIAGAVVGNALSGGRDAATVLGGVAGAAVGSQVNKPAGAVSSVYRVTIQTDAGGWRTYDVPATGDLRIGDRVRVENGVIYRA